MAEPTVLCTRASSIQPTRGHSKGPTRPLLQPWNAPGDPRFAGTSASSAPTVTLERDPNTGLYTKTVTDTRGVLERLLFFYGVAGIQFQVKSGSSLTVTATADAAKELNGSQLAGATGSSLAVDPERWWPYGLLPAADRQCAYCRLPQARLKPISNWRLNLSGTATIQKPRIAATWRILL